MSASTIMFTVLWGDLDLNCKFNNLTKIMFVKEKLGIATLRLYLVYSCRAVYNGTLLGLGFIYIASFVNLSCTIRINFKSLKFFVLDFLSVHFCTSPIYFLILLTKKYISNFLRLTVEI